MKKEPLVKETKISYATLADHHFTSFSHKFCNKNHFTRCSLFNVDLKKLSKKKTSGATSKKPFAKKDPFADESNKEDAEDL
jgi:hypothetical protein